MRVPVSWLADHVALPTSADGVPDAELVGEAFVRNGLELEEIHRVPVITGDLVVGRVLEIEELTEFKKPIRFVTLEVGPGHGVAPGPDGTADSVRQVICGATNFVVDDLVVVALPGAVLPGGFAIASRQTYERLSDGMICSVRELGIGTEHDGILVLGHVGQPELPPIGSDARIVLGSDDPVIELAVTPDRGYALSVRGLTRELASAFDVPFTDPAVAPLSVRSDPGWSVHLDDPGCSRFVTVRVNGLDSTAASPWWLRHRLQQAGIRAISLPVDVTNYVMVLTGQPMHAFDAQRLQGDLRVRRAAAGERLRTLDDADRALDADDLVIADDRGPVSLAGVMGGASTEIGDGTTEVVLEAASWDTASISRTVRRHRLPSEAARRFERFVDPAIAESAAELAAELLVRFGGGRVVGRSVVGTVLTLPRIELPVGEPERLIGRPFPVAVIVDRLSQVGCTVTTDPQGAGAEVPVETDLGVVDAGLRECDPAATDLGGAGVLLVTPPTWRPDLTRPADLVEEIARLEGFDSIPSVLPAAPAGTGLTDAQRRERAVGVDLAAAGLTEVLSFPFVGATELDALRITTDDARRRSVEVVNPLDAERPLLRTTLLPGLVDTAVRNRARGARDLALYEIGQVFLPRTDAPAAPQLSADHRPADADLAVLKASLPSQPVHVGVLLAGAAEPAGWWGPGREWSWSDAIGFARRIAATAGIEVRTVAETGTAPWHPGRCASVRVGDWPIGFAGELHPAVLEQLGLPPRTAAVELDLDGLPAAALPTAPAISPFPPVHLDVALLVDAAVPAARVEQALAAGGGSLLESVRLFDVYTGTGVPDGQRSLAFALVVRAPDRTLTAAEALEVRDAAVAVAAERCGAVLRG
ncbi:phenylalanine--tRNA ligase subunit beta [Nakamurella leprariae]|uniref:Phenylalanine--tRNA ligase beta subunit n=1 Tax=Nakamurella leprariae TaxID=2803911 RepID=A0A938YGL7_9ACTN|nr:phenylalanine--tRNA ligase subunit beta [Nakamurella leprariae]MBM9467759.1 phenylalanine--tRNA ligase subunit beta [Nakamurella leprariae]